ncbi:MAG TPA: hypothetical protein VG963_24680, partial [Polyangiaceae bacterium]|nr:hypothetical protein [Polyangiaceae bacterium]
VRGGRLRVDRELTDDFDPAHPLSEFGVKLWPALAPQHARLAQAATRIAASAFETSYTQLSELARDCAAVTSGEIAQLFVSAMRCQLEKLR